jgi:hypothetical protein
MGLLVAAVFVLRLHVSMVLHVLVLLPMPPVNAQLVIMVQLVQYIIALPVHALVMVFALRCPLDLFARAIPIGMVQRAIQYWMLALNRLVLMEDYAQSHSLVLNALALLDITDRHAVAITAHHHHV